MKSHFLVGSAAAIALFLVYLGIVTPAQGLRHSLEQAASQWYLIAPLSAGFGIQAGLFSYIRRSIKARKASATASVAASGGISGASMVACCAHHLSDVLPVLGIAGIAGLLAQYQSIFLLLGVLSNVVGVAVMLEVMQRTGLLGQHPLSRWNMTVVKKWAIALGAVILAMVSLATFLL